MSNKAECDVSLHDEWKVRAKQAEAEAERNNETDEARCERCGAMSNSEEERDALIADCDKAILEEAGERPQNHISGALKYAEDAERSRDGWEYEP